MARNGEDMRSGVLSARAAEAAAREAGLRGPALGDVVWGAAVAHDRALREVYDLQAAEEAARAEAAAIIQRELAPGAAEARLAREAEEAARLAPMIQGIQAMGRFQGAPSSPRSVTDSRIDDPPDGGRRRKRRTRKTIKTRKTRKTRRRK